MANRRDYSGILKKKDHLKPFNIRWSRLPEYLNNTNEEVESLQISNTVVGRVIQYQGEGIDFGSLVVGKSYIINELQLGDDFSNVGYVSDGVAFIATGTTPTNWSGETTVVATETIFTIIYNDLDLGIVVSNNTNDCYITITNGLFDIEKTFPNIPIGSNIKVEDNNTIYFSKQNGTPRYFKIEVYV